MHTEVYLCSYIEIIHDSIIQRFFCYFYGYRSLVQTVTGLKGHWSDIYVEFNDQVTIIT